MTQPTTAQAARSYLNNKHTTLWSTFDVSKGDNDPPFEAAVLWLTAQVQAVEAERRRLAEERRMLGTSILRVRIVRLFMSL